MDAIAENAARLCEADDALVRRLDGDRYYAVSHFGAIPIVSGIGVETLCDRSTPAGRAVIDKKTIHVPDLEAAADDYPGARSRGLVVGVRTALAAPLLLNDSAIGSIHIRRLKVSPFSDRQIHLLENFADQAVIAIENARLIHEQEARNHDLAEALEQQSATAEILGVIANSPTDIEPVLDTIAASAARICGADDALIRLVEGNVLRLRVSSRVHPVFLTSTWRRVRFSRSRAQVWIPGRAVLDRETIHIQDIAAVENEYPETATRPGGQGFAPALATPLLREAVAIGVIFIRRTEVRPFTKSRSPY